MSNPLSLSGCRHDVLGHSSKAIGILRAREPIGVVRLDLDDEVDVARHARPRIIAGGLYHAALERESGEREALLAAAETCSAPMPRPCNDRRAWVRATPGGVEIVADIDRNDRQEGRIHP